MKDKFDLRFAVEPPAEYDGLKQKLALSGIYGAEWRDAVIGGNDSEDISDPLERRARRIERAKVLGTIQ